MIHSYNEGVSKLRNVVRCLESVIQLLQEASRPEAWTPEEHAAAEAFRSCRDKYGAQAAPELPEDLGRALWELVDFYAAQDFARGFRLGLELGAELWRDGGAQASS